MLGRATGAVLIGVEARLIHVEVDLARGLPTIAAVGLPDSTVREGIDRIRSALRHAGFELPQRRIVVNLAPADVRKHGAALDLAIAVALLQASADEGDAPPPPAVCLGELALDGSVRPVRGALPVALAARRAGHARVVVPPANAGEASLVDGIEVLAVSTLVDALQAARGGGVAVPPGDVATRLRDAGVAADAPDLADVHGQPGARRAIEIAAAGGHHLLLVGPPGSGKTMLARRLPGILPPMSPEEALDATRIASAAGLGHGLVVARPFRAPHHGISAAGMIGGGRLLRPGEACLSTHGVLYLDELPEFRRDALESLRQPLEDGEILLTRVHGSVRLPARFALVASMNPCPCGWYGDPSDRCVCSPGAVARYLSRVSGPLLDRFDLTVEVPAVDPRALARGGASGEPSAAVRRRVLAARRRQRARFGRRGPAGNAAMGRAELDRHARLDGGGDALLAAAYAELGLTARGFDRVRRVARTIADLAGRRGIAATDVAEALELRASVGRDVVRR